MASEGGFYSCFLDNSDCYDPNSRQLVGSARYVANYATAYRLYGKKNHKAWAQWGLDFLTQSHRQSKGQYAWLLESGSITDTRIMAYGHAFVLLAAASGIRAGIDTATTVLYETHDFMDRYFWDESALAYADERDQSLSLLDPYRGQNANMHICKALMAVSARKRSISGFRLNLSQQPGVYTQNPGKPNIAQTISDCGNGAGIT